MSNLLQGRLILSGEDSKKIRDNFREDCILSIGNFEMKFVMIDVKSSRSGKDRIDTEFRMQELNEYMEQNIVKNNDDQQ